MEEKAGRVVEVLLARMPTRVLLAGKIPGIGLFGLVQVAATTVVALVAVTIVGSIDVSPITGSVLAWAVVWFVLVAGYFASFAMIAQPTSAVARAVSFFPLTAPLAMPGRIAMGTTAWWEPVLAAMLTIAAIAGLVWLGGRIYTGAILNGGPTLSLRQAWRHPDCLGDAGTVAEGSPPS